MQYKHKLSASALPHGDVTRFWSKVWKGDGCWSWCAGKYPEGYGSFWFKGKSVGAHRFSWMLHNNSDIPKGLFVCHSCDNKWCVRPNHLFLGTILENNQDSTRKNRRSRGTSRPASRLNEASVLEIRGIYREGASSYRSLAAQYRVTPNTIGQLIRGDTWRWL